MQEDEVEIGHARNVAVLGFPLPLREIVLDGLVGVVEHVGADLGHQKNFFSRYFALTDPGGDDLLVVIGDCRVDKPPASSEEIRNVKSFQLVVRTVPGFSSENFCKEVSACGRVFLCTPVCTEVRFLCSWSSKCSSSRCASKNIRRGSSYGKERDKYLPDNRHVCSVFVHDDFRAIGPDHARGTVGMPDRRFSKHRRVADAQALHALHGQIRVQHAALRILDVELHRAGGVRIIVQILLDPPVDASVSEIQCFQVTGAFCLHSYTLTNIVHHLSEKM